jgi:outer membrane biosynthesis protein TonB
MKLPAKYVAGLLPLLLAGCVHKSNQAQVQQPLAPPIVDTPPANPAPPTNLPPPVVSTPQPTTTDTAKAQPPAPPPKPKHKKPAPKPADQASTSSPPPANTQQASNATSGDANGVSAIGQLSGGDPADVRTDTENSISATERGLHDIGRKLSEQEQKTADQISEFLKEARKALTTGDVDGAHTLAAKAKVLLAELTK